MANPNLRMTIEAQTSGEQDLSNLGASIDKLAARIGTLSKKAEESNTKTAASFKNLSSQLGQAFSGDALGAASKGLQSLVVSFGAAGVAAAGAIEIFKQVGSAASDLIVGQARAAREQINFAQRLGITTAEGLKFSAMAKLAGVDGTSLATASRFIANALEDQSGAGKKAYEALQKLGVATRTQSGAARDLGAVTLDTIKALGSINDAALRVSLSSAILGRGGTRELQPLLDRYRELDRTVTQFGISLDANATAKLSKADEELRKLSEAWDRLRQSLSAKIEPIVIPFVTRIFNAIAPSTGPEKNGTLNSDASWRATADKWLSGTLNRLPSITALAPGMSFDKVGAAINADRLNKLNAESSPEAIDRQITQLKQEADDARLKIDKNVNIADQNAADKEVRQKEAEIRRLELLKKNMLDRPAVIDRLRQEGGAPGALAQFQYKNRVAEGTPEYNRAFQELFQKQLDIARERSRKIDDEFIKLKESADEAGNSFKEGGVADRAARDYFSTSLYRPEAILNAGLPPASASVQIARLSNSAEYQQKIRSITSGPGTETQNAATTLAEQKQLISQELSIEEDKIRGEKDYVTEAGKLADARAEARNKELAAENDYNVALAQIAENRKNVFKESIQGGYDALVGGGGPGLAKYLRGKIIGVGSTIVGNAADQSFNTFNRIRPVLPGQTTTDATGTQSYTFLGNLLKGTFLGTELKGSVSPTIASTDANTKSTDLNSQAVAALYAAITGQSLPGITPLGSGITGGLLSSPTSPLGSLDLSVAGGSGSPATMSVLGNAVSKAGFPAIGGAIQQAGSVATTLQRAFGGVSAGGGLGTLDTSIATGDTQSTFNPDLLSSGPLGTLDQSPATSVSNAIKNDVSGSASAAKAIQSIQNNTAPNLTGLLSDVTGASGTAAAVSAGATLAAAGFGLFQGVSQASKGGAKNIATGIGESLTSIAAFTGPAAPFVLAAGAVSSLIGAIIPDPRQQRIHGIKRTLFANQYEAPTALHVTEGVNGGYSDLGIGGFVRSSTLNPIPNTTNPYVDLPRRTVVPGTGGSGYGTGPTPAPISVSVQTMDAKSFSDNANRITDAVQTAILQNGHPIINALRQQL